MKEVNYQDSNNSNQRLLSPSNRYLRKRFVKVGLYTFIIDLIILCTFGFMAILPFMKRIFLSDKIYRKKGIRARTFLGRKIKPFYVDHSKNRYIHDLYTKWVEEKRDSNFSSNYKGIMIGNRNFSTIGILQDYFHFLLNNLNWEVIIKDPRRFF